MDRSVLSLVEPALHTAPFMGWDDSLDRFHQTVFDNHYGNIAISFQIAYGIGLLVAGRLIDRLGTKWGYALAISIWASASLCHSLVNSVFGFCVARFVLGLGEAGNFPAALKAVSECFPNHLRGLVTGIFNSGSNVSALVMPPVVAYISLRYGWRHTFVITGSLGLLWLLAWVAFPYRTREEVDSSEGFGQMSMPLVKLLRLRGPHAYAVSKALTDGPWWFYLFYLPLYLNRTFGLTISAQYPYLLTVYIAASFGSMAGGALSAVLIRRSGGVNEGRKMAMFVAAVMVLPVLFIPMAAKAGDPWLVIVLFALAAASHQAWSANLLSTPADMFPSSCVSTIVGYGGAAGAIGGAIFTFVVKMHLSDHPQQIFSMTAVLYLLALACFQILVPNVVSFRRRLKDLQINAG